MIRQAIIILILSAVLGLCVNAILPNKIPYIGKYRSISSGNEPIIPPNADENDPPFIALDLAELEFNQGDAIFVDARDPAEFECGTIPGAINVPLDYLPEGDLAVYFDSVFAGVPKDTKIITFCSGDECDLSLHLARNLQAFGYTNISIFFGGYREWEKFGLQVERRKQCGG